MACTVDAKVKKMSCLGFLSIVTLVNQFDRWSAQHLLNSSLSHQGTTQVLIFGVNFFETETEKILLERKQIRAGDPSNC